MFRLYVGSVLIIFYQNGVLWGFFVGKNVPVRFYHGSNLLVW